MKMDNLIKIFRIILILFFLFLGITYFGIAGYKNEIKERNIVQNMAVNTFETSLIVLNWIKGRYRHHLLSIKIEKTEDLYKIGGFPINSSINDSLYLLYYKYLGDENGKVYLQNIKNGDIAFSWDIPLSKIMDDLKKIDENLKDKYFKDSLSIYLTSQIKKNFHSMLISSPIISNDSSLIFHSGSLGYLYKIDKNSQLLWKSKKLVHHSIEVDRLNNIWTCSIDLKNKIANHHKYREDAILCLSPNGEEKYFFPLTNIFKTNKLFKKLIGSSPNYKQKYGLDPYHLNDVLPISNDGEYWKKDDLLLSIRNQSMIMLYRPASDSIIWQQQGPWLQQHDINIVNDSIISVFNNNFWFFSKRSLIEPNSTSNIALFNLTDTKTSFKYNNIFTSSTSGRQTQIENSNLLIEETNSAKYYIIDSLGSVSGKFYIPYYSDSNRAMFAIWSRVYIKNHDNYILQ